jgi:hypothetical protein
VTFSAVELEEAAELARSFRLASMRLRLLAQPQVQREIAVLARDRARLSPEGYLDQRERLANRLRNFFTAEEIDMKVDRLVDPEFPDELVWTMNFVRETSPAPPRQRAPRTVGASFRHEIEPQRGIWVDERIESAARHIAAGLDKRESPGWAPKADTAATARQQVKRLRNLLP